MKKTSLSIFFFTCMVLFSFLVVAQSINVLEDKVDVIAQQGNTEQFTITVENTGTETATLEFITAIDLEDNEGDEILLDFPTNVTVDPGNSTIVPIDVIVDPTMDFATYSGTVTVRDITSNEEDSFDLNIQVMPDVCDFGVVGDDLVIDIEEPDNNDDFKPGDIMKIKVEVRNEGLDDIRTQLEAFLFNEDDNIADTASKTINIEDDDDETFTMELEIPKNSNDVGEDDNLILFIKAFDDDNEHLNCVQDSVDVEVDLEKTDVEIVEEKTLFFPSNAICGDTVSLKVDVINLGTKDADVEITVENAILDISKSSGLFELERFSSDDFNEKIEHFDIFIPENAPLGEYDFYIRASFGGKVDTLTIPLDVVSCDLSTGLPPFGFEMGAADMSVLTKGIVLAADETQVIHVTLKNNDPFDQIFVVSIKDVADFANGGSRTVTVPSLGTTNVFVPLTIHEEILAGKYTAVVEVSDGFNTVASQTVTITVSDMDQQVLASAEEKSTVQSIPIMVWVLLNIVIITAFVFVLRFFVREFKKNAQKVSEKQ